MPETGYKEIPLTFEKGLVTEIEESTLDVGQAAELLNWEPAANGVLRARNRWASLSKAGLPTTYNVRGFGVIAVGAGVNAVAAPVIVQTLKWPDASAEPLTTKTLTATGCTIGNVLVAVVSDNSGLTPSVTAGWTQRAISTGTKQYVKFYTKTAAASTEPFTYTITAAKIRAVTVYEIQDLDAEDPGTKWGADAQLSGSDGSSSVTATAVDTDGGFALIGYTYDGGTPATGDSGAAGMTTSLLDNANTRTTASYEDLDQLDVFLNLASGTSAGTVLTTPSWTPPSTGIILILGMGTYNSFTSTAPTVVGNGLTWNVTTVVSDITASSYRWYAWADCSLVAPTAGTITITQSVSLIVHTLFCPFVLLRGVDTAAPIINAEDDDLTASPQGKGTNTAQPGAMIVSGVFQNVGAGAPNVAPLTGGTDFSTPAPLDTMSTANASLGAAQVFKMAVSTNNPGSGAWRPRWSFATYNPYCLALHIKGIGNAAQSRHGTFPTVGGVTETFDYVANKQITAKLVLWGYTPRATQGVANQVNFYIVVALATDATTYKIYRLLRDEITTGTWELIDTVTDATNTSPLVAFAQGAGRLAWSSTSLTAPRSILLNPLTPSNISDLLGLAGRCLAYHKDRLFVSGSNANPSRVFFSDIGLPTTFITATDFLDIGGDDGEAVQETISVEGLLLVCKVNRLYLISGSGIESFFVNELPGGSAAGGRPAIRTPYGTIVAGADDIWVVQGGGVDPMSRPLGSGYEITGNVSTSYGQDTVLVCDSATGQIWRVNLVTGAWGLEAVSGAKDVDPVYHLFSLNGRLYYGTNASTTDLGGKRQLSDARIHDETSGGTVYAAKTGKMALLGPQHKYTPRWLFLQVRNHTPTLPSPLTVTITTDIGDPEVKPVMVTREVQRVRVDLGAHKGAEWIQVGLNAGASSVAGALDVEKAVLGALVERIR